MVVDSMTAVDSTDPAMPDSVVQVHIPTRDGDEYEQLAEVTAETDPLEASVDADERTLILSRGGEIEPPDWEQRVTIQVGPDGKLQRSIIPDEGTAIGYYLHAIETHGHADVMADYLASPDASDLLALDEAAAHDKMAERVDMQPYVDLQESLGERDRRLRLLDLLDERIDDGDWAAEKYLDEYPATWRSTGLSESGEQLAWDIARTIDVKPRMCYHTAQHAAMLHEDNHRVTYVEGIVLPKQAGQAIRHAWIEIDGDVAELTWPWHVPDGADAVYFGTEFPISDVIDARDRRRRNGALALTDAEVDRVTKAMAGDLAPSDT